MLWGTGSGRCGTKSLAKQLGGLHEPSPKLVPDPLSEAAAIEVLRFRRDMETPVVVDFKQSFVLHLIREVDLPATFAWVVRNPFDTIISYRAGNAEMTFEAAVQRWLVTNQNCLAAMNRDRSLWKLFFCDELTEHQNQYLNSPTFRIDREQAKAIADRCYPLWNEILALR